MSSCDTRITALEERVAELEGLVQVQQKNTAEFLEVHSIEVGNLSDEQLKRFELGPYSKNSTFMLDTLSCASEIATVLQKYGVMISQVEGVLEAARSHVFDSTPVKAD